MKRTVANEKSSRSAKRTVANEKSSRSAKRTVANEKSSRSAKRTVANEKSPAQRFIIGSALVALAAGLHRVLARRLASADPIAAIVMGHSAVGAEALVVLVLRLFLFLLVPAVVAVAIGSFLLSRRPSAVKPQDEDR